VLREICDFIELPYEPAMQHDPARAAGRLREHGARHDESGRLVLSRDARARQQATTAGPIDPSKVGAWRTYFTRKMRRRSNSPRATYCATSATTIRGRR
jgi:hypothetical protein